MPGDLQKTTRTGGLLKQCTVVNSEKLPFNQKIFMNFFKKLWKLSEPDCFDQTRPE